MKYFYLYSFLRAMWRAFFYQMFDIENWDYG